MRIPRTSQPKGYLLPVLHAHLPFIRYPQHEYHLEENWFYEATTETYIPLLAVLERLIGDRIDFRLTLSLSPSLIEMFNDRLLRERYERHLGNLLELSEKEVRRTRKDAGVGPVARMYRDRFREVHRIFEDTYRKDLTGAFRSVMETGAVEIIPSAATHGYLPALMTDPVAARSQIMVAAGHFRRHFGCRPQGIWLPECGFVPGIDHFLKEAGIGYFFLEAHGILGGRPKTSQGIYAPVRTPSGIAAFGRDVESSKQVWSAAEGYPGDFDYRDFYRDIGFDLAYAYVSPHLPAGIRTFTGMKYYRITGTSDRKKPYVVNKAFRKAAAHAEHFLKSREEQIAFLRRELDITPVITMAYDAELFGHWWFEGPEWLDLFLRKGAACKSLRFVTPSEYLSEHPAAGTVMPSPSSWGSRGYSRTWIDASNNWLYRHLHRASRSLSHSVRSHPHADGVLKRALAQALRELLLAQASDWPFMMKTGSASAFAKHKFLEHMSNFLSLNRMIRSGKISREKLIALEEKNCIFRELDHRIYGWPEK